MKTYYKWKDRQSGYFFTAVEQDLQITDLLFGDIKIQLRPLKTPLMENLEFQISEYFKGKLKKFDIKYKTEPKSEFEKRIIESVEKIQYGEVSTYKKISAMAGNEKAFRAAANIISKNRILILIPCHRVILSSGKTGGYSAGEEIKKVLLQIENKYKKTV